MANDRFGALVTASGGGYLWYGNSQMGKLTPWFNDPLRDPSAQLLRCGIPVLAKCLLPGISFGLRPAGAKRDMDWGMLWRKPLMKR